MKKLSKKKKIIIIVSVVLAIPLLMLGYLFFDEALPKIGSDILNSTVFKQVNKDAEAITQQFCGVYEPGYLHDNEYLEGDYETYLNKYIIDEFVGIEVAKDKKIIIDNIKIRQISTEYITDDTAKTTCVIDAEWRDTEDNEEKYEGWLNYMIYWRMVGDKWEVYNVYSGYAKPVFSYSPNYAYDDTSPY